jgi:hypothetical protein
MSIGSLFLKAVPQVPHRITVKLSSRPELPYPAGKGSGAEGPVVGAEDALALDGQSIS